MAPRLARVLGHRGRRFAASLVVVLAFATTLAVWTRGPELRTSDANAAHIARAGAGAPPLVTTGPSLPPAGDNTAPQTDTTSLPNGIHDVVITVTSDRPLLAIGWKVRGNRPPSRKLTSVRSPFRLHVLAHGEGLVASVAAQAAPDAARTTCSITVDGTVRSTRVRKGGYEVVVCLG